MAERGPFMFLHPPDHGFRCRPDLCAQETSVPPSEQLGKFWCDSLVHDAAALDLLTEVVGKVGDGRRIDLNRALRSFRGEPAVPVGNKHARLPGKGRSVTNNTDRSRWAGCVSGPPEPAPAAGSGPGVPTAGTR